MQPTLNLSLLNDIFWLQCKDRSKYTLTFTSHTNNLFNGTTLRPSLFHYYETWRQYATLLIYYHWFVTSFESSISQENYLIRLLVINSSRNFAKISVETQDPKYTVRDYIFRFKWLFLPTKAHPYLYTGIKLKVTLPLRAPVWNISCRQRLNSKTNNKCPALVIMRAIVQDTVDLLTRVHDRRN